MRRIAVGLILAAAFLSAAASLRYLFAAEFMPYHAVVAGRQWAAIEPGTQTIILGMLRILAGGFLASGLALAFLCVPLWRGERWAAWAILLVGAAVWGPTLSVTLMLKAAQPAANPPTLATLALLVLIAAGSLMAMFAKRGAAPAAG